MRIETVFMLPPLILSFYIKDGATSAFLCTIGIILITAFIMEKTPSSSGRISPKDGLFIVSIGWIFASIFGALPLYISKSLPTYIDCLFEIVSGFTTTGASVIEDVEVIAPSVVLWRSITHWIGGMGILVFTISLLPKLGVGGFQIFKAESPGPVAGKIEPKVSQTAKRLYSIYMIITIVLFILLLIGGMTPFDAIIHTLGVVGTGGFSSKTASVAHYNSWGYYIPIVMSMFMVFCGTNFSLYYLLYKKKIKSIFQDEEFRIFYGIIIFSIIIVGFNLYCNNYGTLGRSMIDSLFQVTSISSTSGFATADYDMWPSFSKYILLVLYFIGSSAGSTAGGMKVVRIVVMFKLVKREIQKVLHPKAVIPIKLNNKILNDEIVMGIMSFLGAYIIIFITASAIVALSGVDILTSISSVVTMLSNVGPGFSAVGPTKNFFFFGVGYKMLFCMLMLLGRLEIFTMLALLSSNSIGNRYVKGSTK
ncbi:cation transport protein [Peptoniphilus sp. oral taxon 386 str. F0131]|nr:cation transport protein [Peptoniphilus sp. oral taxon 386 str. F0131]